MRNTEAAKKLVAMATDGVTVLQGHRMGVTVLQGHRMGVAVLQGHRMGVAVLQGHRMGVAARIKANQSNLTVVHCMTHQLELA